MKLAVMHDISFKPKYFAALKQTQDQVIYNY